MLVQASEASQFAATCVRRRLQEGADSYEEWPAEGEPYVAYDLTEEEASQLAGKRGSLVDDDGRTRQWWLGRWHGFVELRLSI